MQPSSFVTVIIPAYKAEKYIQETILSVLRQTYEHLECLVIDDGSPDQLGEIVKKLAIKDTRLKYFRQKNAGVSAARNFGIAQAKGNYLAFLDADDVWGEDNLLLKVKLLVKDKEAGLVHSDGGCIDQQSRPIGEVIQGKEGWLLDALLAWEGTCVPPPSSILVRKEVVQKIGAFHPNLSNNADQEFYFRLAAHYKIIRLAQVSWYYRIHDQQMHVNIPLLEKDTLRAYYLAQKNNLFRSQFYRRYCYANMYLILAACWWGDGNNKLKGIKYLIKALTHYPPAFTKLLKKMLVS